jgi:myo-inositol-1(or 4)-monophosphatase
VSHPPIHPLRASREDLELATRLAADASDLALRLLAGGDRETEWKSPGEHDPVTVIDRAVDELVIRTLRAERPDDGLLTEESPDDRARLASERVWIVDPIDGTRSLVDQTEEWTVSIGLVVAGRPCVGAIAHPPSGIVVSGATGHPIVDRAGRPLPRPTPPTRLEDATLVLSRSRGEGRRLERLREHVARVHRTNSAAWKLLQLVLGEADLYVCARPLSEWDVAGGAALLAALGGTTLTPTGAPTLWNQPTPRWPGLIAATTPALAAAATPFLDELGD